jgi:Domain of unknown function (DUF4232)
MMGVMAKSTRNGVLTVVVRSAVAACLAVAGAAGCVTSTRSSAPTNPPSSIPKAVTLASFTAGAPGTTAASRATETRYAAPVDRNARELGSIRVSGTVSGSCIAGSDVIGNVSVYRCFAGNEVYDPCWASVTPGSASAGGALCLRTPWSTSAVKVVARGISASIKVKPTDQNVPWGLRLSTRQRCLAEQGAHNEFRGQFIDFTCTGGAATGSSLELLQGVNRDGPTWTYRSVVRSGTALRPGPVVDVHTAWFAGPEPLGTTPRCKGSDLAVSAGPPRTAQGHFGVPIVFRNTGSVACTLFGYPQIAALDVKGRQVSQARRSPSGHLGGLQPGDTTPSAVLAAPGGTVSALVEGTDVSNGAATACAAYPALLVTPPSTTTSVRLSQPLPSCSTLQVHPVVDGESGTSP